ncbi:MAG: bacillithiol system redox-active protein YtxJ [Pyrinomonadaceae bacterium]
METKFAKISDRTGLEDVIAKSKTSPVIVFKHSLSCPLSAAAYHEMEQMKYDIRLVEVQTAKDISKQIADMTGIRHESPQVIIIRNGKAVWNASHYDVQAHVIEQAIQHHT